MGSRGGTPPQSRRIFLSGLGSQAYIRLGSFRYISPTLRRKRSQTQYQTYATGTLTVAARFVPLAEAWEYQTAKDLAGNGGYTWKDMLISGFFGNAIEFTDVNGVKWEGRRILANNIQSLLDSISAVPGSMLVRTTTAWAALYPGPNNYVCTIDPATGIPNWLPAASSGGGGAFTSGDASIFIDPNAGSSTTANIFDGSAVILRAGMTVGHLEFYSLTNVPTATVQAGIYNRSANAPSTLVASSAVVTGVNIGLNKLALTTPLVVAADDVYWIGIHNKAAAFSAPQTPSSPFWQFVQSGALPTTAPAGTAGNAAGHLKVWVRP